MLPKQNSLSPEGIEFGMIMAEFRS